MNIEVNRRSSLSGLVSDFLSKFFWSLPPGIIVEMEDEIKGLRCVDSGTDVCI